MCWSLYAIRTGLAEYVGLTSAYIHTYIPTYLRTYVPTYVRTYVCMSVCIRCK